MQSCFQDGIPKPMLLLWRHKDQKVPYSQHVLVQAQKGVVHDQARQQLAALEACLSGIAREVDKYGTTKHYHLSCTYHSIVLGVISNQLVLTIAGKYKYS